METYQGNYSNQANAAVKAPESASPLRDALSQTEQGVEALHQAISELEKRLETVLMPIPPSGDSIQGATPAPMMSNLRQRVTQTNAGFIHAIDRINELRRRTDV